MIGTELGPYRITAKLGEGGMGVVWRAQDTQLGRDVAIKVLPEAFTEDPERLGRFEREARLLAQLQHPHVASIFGLQQTEGLRALVMELVEGPTLGERIAEGPLPLEEALSVARQIAEALEAAHAKGIIHRDLKPHNVKVTPEGTVKVLDFGLAKAMDSEVGPGSTPLASPTLLNSPTLTAAGTQLGVILGTAAYMAPEQARGAAVDRRADIWAFGVVLWEMLTGASMFAAETVSDTLAGVLRAEIDLDRLPDGTPPAIRRLLRWTLARDPKDRLHDIADARIVLDEALSGRSEEEKAPPLESPTAPWRRALPWVVAALGIAAALIALLVAESRPPGPRLLRADLGAPEGERFHFQGDYGAPAILSPDGRLAVFGAVGEGGTTHLWLRSLESGEERRLEGTDGAFAPFFSPDSTTIGFFAGSKLRTVSLGGGSPLTIADAPNGRGGAWFPDGQIVFSPDFRAGLFRVRATGGAPEPLSQLDTERHSSHRWPAATPDGRALVYLATTHEWARQKEAELRWMRLDGSGDHALLPSRANGLVAEGRLLFFRESTLFAQPIDETTGALSGEAAVLAQDLLYDPSTWRATFSAAAGRLLFSPAGSNTGSHLSRLDRTGRVLEELAPEGLYFDLTLSPDGRRLVVSRDAPTDLWLLDLERHTFGRFSFEDGDEYAGVWSPDGRWIYYVAIGADDRRDRIYRKAPDGGGGATLVYESDPEVDLSPCGVSPDGRWLLVLVGDFPFLNRSDLGLLSLDEEPRLVPLVESPSLEDSGRFSPDGRWLVYSGNESGTSQIYVRSADPEAGEASARWQVSVDGGARPIWSPDGTEIVYLEPSLNLSRVAVAEDGAGGLRFGPPEPLFGTTLLSDQQSFDLAPDGQSFIVNHYGEAQSRPLRLVDGWPSLLPAR